jgi:hypothetical protein
VTSTSDRLKVREIPCTVEPSEHGGTVVFIV